MKQQNEEHIIFLYELGHFEVYERFLAANPDVRVGEHLLIALGLELEHALAEKGISFRSGRSYRPQDIARFTLADEWTAKLFESDAWKWFHYRGISLAQMFFYHVQLYLIQALYYTALFGNVLTQHRATKRLTVFPSRKGFPSKWTPLISQQLECTVACAKLAGAAHGVEVFVPPLSTLPVRARANRFLSTRKQRVLEAGITLYNFVITLFKPRGSPRILVSDYWSHVAPLLSQLPHGEMILFDRSEALNAGLANLWRFRVRLCNFDSFSTRERTRVRAEAEKAIEERWTDVRACGLPEFSLGTTPLNELIVGALDDIFTNAMPQALRDIDGAFALLHETAPDSVFLRASVSAQTHFYILARVAHACGIPSLELQHGLEYLDTGSLSKRHSAEYVAVYGRLVQDEFATLGFSREHIPVVGSPRFDTYKAQAEAMSPKKTETGEISVLCIGNASGGEWTYDDYDIEEYYSGLAQALEKISGSSVIVKLRPGPYREAWSRALVDRTFARVPHTIAQYETFPDLFAQADAVVSGYSTTILEALQFGMPVVVLAKSPIEAHMARTHFSRYASEHALLIANTDTALTETLVRLAADPELRSRMRTKAQEFIANHYCFDGNASPKITALITELSRQPTHRK